MTDDDELMFADDDEEILSARERDTWKILIVDDEEEVHNVTPLALDGFKFAGRELEFVNAYSGAEAKKVMEEHPDIALILLDVVMETDHSGLDVVQYVRDELKNKFVRIILRTGQPGQAPEHDVISNYDINDYKHKTELTREKMFTVMHTSLSAYRDLMALEASRRGLEMIIEATHHLFEIGSLEEYAQGMLEQLAALLYVDREALVFRVSGLAAEDVDDDFKIVAAIGRYNKSVGQSARDILHGDVLQDVEKSLDKRESIFNDNHVIAYFEAASGTRQVFYLASGDPVTEAERHTIETFCKNVALAYEKLVSMCAERQE